MGTDNRYRPALSSTSSASDQLIDNYLREVRTSAWIRQLPKSRTEAIEDAVRGRIAADLAAAGNRDEATVYRVLDRLGPASDVVATHTSSPSRGAGGLVGIVLTPIARVRSLLGASGWGVGEIGGLLLLIVGPFLVWWIGPLFGILLVRYSANRWSLHSMQVATRVVFVLLAVQGVAALALLMYVALTTGIDAEWTRRLMSDLSPTQLFHLDQAADIPLFMMRLVGAFLAPIAGITSGLYLAFSPRVRR
jgi:hypothetical protein